MSEELKANKCYIMFDCDDIVVTECVYRSGNRSECKYMNGSYQCTSKVAQVNAATLFIKEMTKS